MSLGDDPSKRNIRKKLFQENPRKKSKWPGLHSKTESLESYRRAAEHERNILELNGTIPNHIVHLNYKAEFSVEEIKALWRSHSRRLRDNGVIARVAIEITKDKRRRHPENRVHYHIAVKDDRTRDELKELFVAVCQCEMSPSDFKVHVFPFEEIKGGWKGYIAYFVKLARRDEGNVNYLFKSNLRLWKYYTIGQWWTYPDGRPRLRGSIEEEASRLKRERRKRDFYKTSERFIEVKRQRGWWEDPTDHDKLKAVLDKERDTTLYDWFSILLGQPTIFKTIPPEWLLDDIQRQPLKRDDLLRAIYERLCRSDNVSILSCLEIYHGLSVSVNKQNTKDSQ